MDLNKIIDFLKKYDGPRVKLMEVCGTHTSAIVKSGIRSLISKNIKLISGPGCPVCVTPSSYIDKCLGFSMADNHVLASFGDMMRVPGSSRSLSHAKSEGGRVELMYSPFEILSKAKKDPGTTYVIAAVGFETTAAVYAQLLKEIREGGAENVKLLTSLKTIIPALSRICEDEKGIDGFICPGHVSVITGSKAYEKLCDEYKKPFIIAGFEPSDILVCIYELLLAVSGEKPIQVGNLYKNAVRDEGNKKAQVAMAECFTEGNAVWRGIGTIENSGLYLNSEYSNYDAGSAGLDYDKAMPSECRCGDVIVGRIDPDECPMFRSKCTPSRPLGPCMVSSEGACGIWS